MDEHHFPAAGLLQLRRGTHKFLRQRAARAWEHKFDGGRWQIRLPPDVAALPEHQRYRTHARQEARRLAIARLYDLDPGISARAIYLGAAIRRDGRKEAATRSGHPQAVATMGIQPPADSGFVHWQDAIGCNALGAPVVACHWGPWGPPGTSGHWLAWWADGRAMAAAYAAQARADGAHADPELLAQAFGPLWYDHQDLLQPAAGNTPGTSSIPGPERDDAGTPPGDGDQPGTPGVVLFYTTLATWHLLTRPDAGVRLSQHPVPADEQDADRAAGLRPCPAIVTASARNP
jgi:hypothetical protein